MSTNVLVRPRVWAVSLVIASTVGCSTPLGMPGAAQDPADAGATSSGLVVHEWGTFTSVMSSRGQQMEGMHHEEEALPPFVHARMFGDPNHNKGVEWNPVGVTQKLETPVLYFYSPSPAHVNVKVDFPQGLISQWFPSAVTFEPQLWRANAAAGGSMTWDVDLVPGLGGFPVVPADSIWDPSRHVASVPVRATSGGPPEQFIFYRGIGAFATPFTVTGEQDGSLTMRNGSPDKIQAVFMLRVHQGGGAVVNLGSLASGDLLSHVFPPVGGKEINPDQYVLDASSQIAAELVKSGLNADEAKAMVDTWSRSYFRSFGTRILFIVPRSWTDKLLPITIEPKPDALVRTLVGRVEALTISDEVELVAMVKAAAANQTPVSTFVTSLGRLAEPKLRRTLQLLTDPAATTYCTAAVTEASGNL